MEKEVFIGQTRFRLHDFERENSVTLYKLEAMQRYKNVMVDCYYYEGKPHEESGIKDISFRVVIRAFGRNPSDTYYYEIYANGNNYKYNHIVRCTEGGDKTIKGGSQDAEMLEKFLTIIKNSFDEYAINFIDLTLKTIDAKRLYSGAPNFIKDTITQIQTTNIKGV
jgi:hypothetical protein